MNNPGVSCTAADDGYGTVLVPRVSTTNGTQDTDEGSCCFATTRDIDVALKKAEVIDGQPLVTCYDVAEYVLRKLGRMSTMKLQKLVYYCQAWALVWDEEPLFQEPIEAWANGPVVRALFDYHRGLFDVDHVVTGNPDALSSGQRMTVDAVLSFYGDKSAQWLIDLSHTEQPWISARRGMSATERGSSVIGLAEMAEYFSSLHG